MLNLQTFLQFLRHFIEGVRPEINVPKDFGSPQDILPYMAGEGVKLLPISDRKIKMYISPINHVP